MALIWSLFFVMYLRLLFQVIADLSRDRELGRAKALRIIELIVVPFEQTPVSPRLGHTKPSLSACRGGSVARFARAGATLATRFWRERSFA